MKLKHPIELEVMLTAIFFMILIATFPPSQNDNTITGKSISSSLEGAQVNLQHLLRDDTFDLIGDNAKACIIIGEEKDNLSFEVRKIAGVFNVKHSEFYCNGMEEEDIVLKFDSLDTLADMGNMPLDRFIKKKTTPEFEIWRSKYVRQGQHMICNEEFKDKYCAFALEHINKKKIEELSMGCCLMSDVEKPAPQDNFLSGFLGPILSDYWWLLALIIISSVFGLGALFVLSNEDEPDQDSVETVIDYIEKARKSDIGDKIIHEKLTDAGWDDETIHSALKELRNRHVKEFADRFERVTIDKIFKHEGNYKENGNKN